MSFSDIFNVAIVVGFVAYVGYSVQHSRKRDWMFRAVGERLGARDFTHDQGSLSGSVRGLPLSARFVGATKSTPQHTTIEVGCSPCALVLHLRPQTDDELREVARGEAVDVVVGDPAFDGRWIVEGAPADRVRRILSNHALRAQLVAFSRVPGANVSVEDGKVTVYRLGTEVGPEAIATERMELAVTLAEIVIADARAPIGPGEMNVAASSYRSAVRVDPAAAEAAQVHELQTLRAVRAVRQLRVAAILVSSFTTGMMLMVRAAFGLPAPAAIALAFFALFGTIAIVAAHRAATKSAPHVSRDSLTVRWMVGCWIVNLALIGGAFAGE